MAGRNHTHKLPSSAELSLKDGLSARIKELWTTAAENSYELYLYAAALRRRYLDPAEGEYSPEFKDWYATHEMKTLLGNMSSFTKYALAGETVLYFAHDFEGGKYVNQLPVSRNALYELSQLVKPIQEGTSQLSQNDLEKLFFAGGKDSEAR